MRKLFFLVSLCLCFFLAACGADTTSTGTPSSSPVAQSTQAPAKPTPTPKPLKWTTVQHFSGNGTQKTAVFSVPDDWKILWTCDPSSFMAQYNVVVSVYGTDGSLVDLAINALCKPGDTSGMTEEHQAGSIYLSVDSEAKWTVDVQVLK